MTRCELYSKISGCLGTSLIILEPTLRQYNFTTGGEDYHTFTGLLMLGSVYLSILGNEFKKVHEKINELEQKVLKKDSNR